VAYHPGSLHFDAQQQGVAVTVGVGRDDLQTVPRTFSLHPKLLARAAEEGYVAFLDRLLQGLAIHKSHHQDCAIARILDDCRDEATHFFEIEFCIHTVLPLADPFLADLSRRNKKPAERFRVSGPELLKSACYFKSATSGVHRRRRAMRGMVMAMMQMRQHSAT
jgi:hypothetical protein